MKSPLESDIQKQCLQWLALHQFRVWRQNSGAAKLRDGNGKARFIRFAAAVGVPDVVGWLPGGRFLGIEFKRPGKSPTADQQQFLDRLNADGGLGLCVHSLEELIEGLREEDR
jgi:VRR-NUC domain-containing protein